MIVCGARLGIDWGILLLSNEMLCQRNCAGTDDTAPLKALDATAQLTTQVRQLQQNMHRATGDRSFGFIQGRPCKNEGKQLFGLGFVIITHGRECCILRAIVDGH